MHAPRQMIASLGIVLLLLGGVAPSADYNVPGQSRTRTCTPIKGSKIALRFPDGSPTGFYAWADDPSTLGSSQTPCEVGSLELDAHEILKNAAGQAMYFHPGGAFYKDRVNNGQYGQVFATDLKAPPKLIPSKGTGQPARLAHATYLITPTRIPPDMYYKPNVVNGSSGSTYYTYGNPGYDKTGGRGDWTYINWSWVQNGGSEYPANICRGGGMVRALGKRDALFRACDVAPIVGYSYGRDNKINGRVTAFYGLTKSGANEKGSDIYGWLVQSYQKTGGPIVTCVRRSGSAAGKGTLPRSDEAMVRMANNIFAESAIDSAAIPQAVADASARYASTSNALDRMELLTELARMDSPATIDLLIEKLSLEPEALVREQAIVLLGFMRSTGGKLDATCAAFAKDFVRSKESAERLRIVEVASSIASPNCVDLLRQLREATIDPAERFAIAEALFRLSARVNVDEALLREVTSELEIQARDKTNKTARLRAMRILATVGRDNRPFLSTLLKDESDVSVRNFLKNAIESFPAE